jgi:hypothetical protein
MADHLDSKNLVPFKRRHNGYHLPGLQKDSDEQVIDEVDPELRPDEQGFVRHFLAYADVLLNNAAGSEQASEAQDAAEAKRAQDNNVTEMPRRDDEAA